MTIKEFEVQLALGSLSYDDKAELASNCSTPKNILTKLSMDEDSGVRWWIANNHSTPRKILIVLSKDEDWYVRDRVASNPNTPAHILTKLSKDTHNVVRYRAGEKLSERK